MKNLHKDQTYIKLYNIDLVFELIRRTYPITRKELVEKIGISQTSVTRILNSLKKMGLIMEEVSNTKGYGRRAMLLNVNRNSYYSAGIEIDRGTACICLTDISDQIVAYEKMSINSFNPVDEFVERVKSCLLKLMASNYIKKEQMLGIGISCIGIIETKTGMITFAPMLKWRDVAIGSLVSKSLDIPVTIQNDVKTRLISEALHNPEIHSKSITFLSIGSGVGAAVMNEGEILLGINNSAGEIGHLLVDSEGDICTCGRKGCLQTIISESAILQRYKKAKNHLVNMDGFMLAFEKNEPEAVEVLEYTVHWMTVAIVNCATLYNTEYIILGGTLVNKYPIFYNKVVQQVETSIYEPTRKNLKIVIGGNDPLACVVGAAVNAQNKFLSDLFVRYENEIPS